MCLNGARILQGKIYTFDLCVMWLFSFLFLSRLLSCTYSPAFFLESIFPLLRALSGPFALRSAPFELFGSSFCSDLPAMKGATIQAGKAYDEHNNVDEIEVMQS